MSKDGHQSLSSTNLLQRYHFSIDNEWKTRKYYKRCVFFAALIPEYNVNDERGKNDNVTIL
jgi:hypothetical protein